MIPGKIRMVWSTLSCLWEGPAVFALILEMRRELDGPQVCLTDAFELLQQEQINVQVQAWLPHFGRKGFGGSRKSNVDLLRHALQHAFKGKQCCR